MLKWLKKKKESKFKPNAVINSYGFFNEKCEIMQSHKTEDGSKFIVKLLDHKGNVKIEKVDDCNIHPLLSLTTLSVDVSDLNNKFNDLKKDLLKLSIEVFDKVPSGEFKELRERIVKLEKEVKNKANKKGRKSK